ncbi:hypothetical protein PTTG_28251 [Puccinia triticina 1-1 BBBD Race 1]|uniref:Major facilitator superfamily (MFS) profile domain-containing protein n=1 Tax=Puccinia triticina (isolate 1-1 / race 1 (BBBD)) TaxID=630390 RepID=A0A180GFD0_PUCT1|nr:hypothetical protein PTTG_28251 [Puccinia triticina 1-1 BBBD Race 1]WAR52196.1 hypothetical protein PtB15_1B635 [Puccinia triticina]
MRPAEDPGDLAGHQPTRSPAMTPSPGTRREDSKLFRSLGLAQDVKPLNVLAYLASSFVSVSSLVFISASTSFVLTAVIHLPADRIGRTNGALILLDELVALPAVLVWGRLADIYGYRTVTVIGHLAVAISLSIYIQSRFEYQLFLCRVILSIGFAALTTMLSTILASMTAARLPPPIPAACEESANSADERGNLISRIKKRSLIVSQRSSRLSGLIGFTSGLGALFGVFFLLRLPSYFASWSHSPVREALESGVRASFYVASTIAFLTSILMVFGLCRRGENVWPIKIPSSNPSTHWKTSIQALTLGFKLIKQHRHLIVAYAAGFAARATTIGVTGYIPVFVNQYYISTGQCQLDRPDAPADEVKKGCHAAFALASALTGTVQLSALLLSPVVGWMASVYPQPRILAVSNILSALGFLAFGLLPRPNYFLVWPTCILLGLSQITGIVVSLSLCASCRWQIFHSESAIARQSESTPLIPHPLPSDRPPPLQDISGAIAGVYSLAGGLGILLGSFGGILSDWSPRAPFFLTGGIASLAGLVCILAGHPVDI